MNGMQQIEVKMGFERETKNKYRFSADKSVLPAPVVSEVYIDKRHFVGVSVPKQITVIVQVSEKGAP